jgi:Domain of unknown function (DUF3854)
MIMAKLSSATLNDLKRSGFNLKQIEAMQIRDVSPDELAATFRAAYAKLGLKGYRNLPEVHAYEIPYFDFKGKPAGYSRYRLLEEFIPEKGKKAAKYMQLPGTKSKFYLSPFCDWEVVAHDVTQAVYFVEGEKKAAALTLLGFPAIGLGGVWNWKTEGGELIPDFNQFEWAHRKTLIAFDQDV